MRRRACVLGATFLIAGAAVAGLLLWLWSPLSSADHEPALRRLTHDGASTPLAWTPEGEALLVRRPGQVIGQQQVFELWAVAAARGRQGERRLSENAFSPSVRQGQVAYLRFAGPGRWQAVVADLEAGQATELGSAVWRLAPRWVGSALHYLNPSGQLTASSGAGPRLSVDAVRPALSGARASLSHDGRLVAAADRQALWVYDGQGPIDVARGVQVWWLAWSPVQARLAYVVSGEGPQPELWVWDAQSGRSWMLARGALEHWEAPAWSPDGRRLAFARHPTGSGPNANGDIWLADVDGDRLYPLAETPADEGAPCWSPDGRSLAFSLAGDVWVARLDDPRLDQAMRDAAQAGGADDFLTPQDAGYGVAAAPLGLTPPLTIRVQHDGTRNACRDVPDGQIDELALEEYLRHVVPHEVFASWPSEALKVQVVAARTYAWRRSLDRAGLEYDVKDSTADQMMCDSTDARTDVAVSDTAGQYVSYGGGVIYAFYCAEAGSPTNYRQELNLVAAPYLLPVSDPAGFGQVRRGHSWGMSQWGAYRWAALQGWDYQQILCHYYTSAAVTPSRGDQGALASVTLPWPGSYVHADQVYLGGNVASAGAVLTVAFAAQISETWRTVYTDTDAGDGWGYVWPVIGYSDTVTPSIGLQVTAYDGAGRTTASRIQRVGLDRVPPTGTVSISPTEVTTLGVSLLLSGTDPSPVSGTLRVSLGNGDWEWEESAFSATTGTFVSDTAAGDGLAWHVSAAAPGALRGPMTVSLPAGEAYQALFRLKVPTAALTSPLQVARLAVLHRGGPELLGVRYLRGTDWQAGDVYQECAVGFDYPVGEGALDLQVEAYGPADLWADRVRLVSFPTAASSWMSWTLPAREGVVTVSARFVDQADNGSPDAAVTVTVRDESPPQGWRLVKCNRAICAAQVQDAIAGLEVGSAAVRHSTDAGLSWSDWLSATCSGSSGSHDWEMISATVPTTLPLTTGRIQFRVFDAAALANEGRSPAYEARAQVYLPLVNRRR